MEILFSTLAAEVHLSVNAFDPSRAIAETTSLGIVALCRGVDFEAVSYTHLTLPTILRV